jgi:hypothetical protein
MDGEVPASQPATEKSTEKSKAAAKQQHSREAVKGRAGGC